MRRRAGRRDVPGLPAGFIPPSAALTTPGFGGRYTVIPDSGVTALHCSGCGTAWEIGYHPSLDAVTASARLHNSERHRGRA